MLLAVWQPGETYQVGQRVRWQHYILEAAWAHTTPTSAADPWYEDDDAQPLRARLGRYRVCLDAMRRERNTERERWEAL